MKNGNAALVQGEHSLEFFNGQLLFRSRDGYKFLSPAAVTAAFRNAPVDSGWMPEGVARCGGTGRGDFAVMFFGPQRHQLLIEGRGRPKQLQIPLPALVFFGLGRDYFVWATKTTALDPKAPLFHAPLPNVFHDGRICWGTNKPPRAGVATIRQAWELFITSPFNGHAAGGKSSRHNQDVRQLLRTLAAPNKRFPLADLREWRRSLEAVVSDHLTGGSQNGLN